MSRQRMTKPELFTDCGFVECSTTARLLYLAMRCFVDDSGIKLANCRTLKMEVFPADNFTPEQVRVWINELIFNNMLVEFERNNQLFWYVLGWKDPQSTRYQKLDKPNPIYDAFDESSCTIRRPVDDSSTSVRAQVKLSEVKLNKEKINKKEISLWFSEFKELYPKEFFGSISEAEEKFNEVVKTEEQWEQVRTGLIAHIQQRALKIKYGWEFLEAFKHAVRFLRKGVYLDPVLTEEEIKAKAPQPKTTTPDGKRMPSEETKRQWAAQEADKKRTRAAESWHVLLNEVDKGGGVDKFNLSYLQCTYNDIWAAALPLWDKIKIHPDVFNAPELRTEFISRFVGV